MCPVIHLWVGITRAMCPQPCILFWDSRLARGTLFSKVNVHHVADRTAHARRRRAALPRAISISFKQRILNAH